MNVNTLIAELQKLAAEGHGDLDACVDSHLSGEIETLYEVRVGDIVGDPSFNGTRKMVLIVSST